MRRRPLLLIVEDDRVLRELFRTALSLSNFTVRACEDGIDALRCVEQERPDVVLLDLHLPRVSGTAVFHELRAHAETAGIPIIVVTGMEPPPHLPGATILLKPVSLERLRDAVEHAIQPYQGAWLFTRGNQSVRVVLVGESSRPTRLLVYGPGRAHAMYEDNAEMGIRQRQQAIEQALIADGYRMARLANAERRSGIDRRKTRQADPDRRRFHGPFV
jgi:CheY-like chemotaxis protein